MSTYKQRKKKKKKKEMTESRERQTADGKAEKILRDDSWRWQAEGGTFFP
jgi:hypothetical protein